MKKLNELLGMAALAALGSSFLGEDDRPRKVGYKKSVMPSKDYAKRKKRLKISGRSRNINHNK